MKPGDKYGHLTLIEACRKPRKQGSIAAFRCICDCGTDVVVDIYNLRNGHAQSCGCLQRKRTSEAKRIHGESHTRHYYQWQMMVHRCHNAKCKDYTEYGGRGISVCDEWKSYKGFLSSAGRCPPGLSLERLDVNGNYEPGNVVWGTPTQQARNRRPRHDNNTGVNGVTWSEAHARFTVRIRTGSRNMQVRVDNLLDAVALRYRLEREHWKEDV